MSPLGWPAMIIIILTYRLINKPYFLLCLVSIVTYVLYKTCLCTFIISIVTVILIFLGGFCLLKCSLIMLLKNLNVTLL